LNATSILRRYARPLLVCLGLGAGSIAVPAQDFLSLFRESPSGNYIAGQQALADLNTAEAARFFIAAAEADWDNPLLVERAFVGLSIDGQISRAASVAKQLLNLDPTNELAELVLATEALRERRYTSAEDMLSRIEDGSFTAITGRILQAWALVGDNRYDEAVALMDAMAEDGLADFLVFHRAMMAEAAGDIETAIDLAAEAYEAEPFVARIVEVYARLLANNGQTEEAQAAISAYRDQGLSHPVVTLVEDAIAAGQRPGLFASNVQVGAGEMYHGIGVALARDGNRDLAIVFLRLALYLDPGADVVSLALGQLFDGAGRYAQANAIYDAIPANSPMKPTAVVRVAQNLDALGERPEAIRRLGNIVATQPDDLDAVSVLGDILRYDEQYDEAIEAYTTALELAGGDRPADWRFYYVRGIAYERNQQWELAEADFLRALELNPDQPQVLNYLGYSWVDMGMNLEEALGMIEKAVEAQPQDGYIVDSLGWAFYRLGRIEEAITVLENAVQLMPNDPEINDHLGDAYWRAGRTREARFQWTIAVDVDEDGTVTERAMPKLANGLEAAPDVVEAEDEAPSGTTSDAEATEASQ
jgi:tetratricopeptide (TPR) repeat protein